MIIKRIENATRNLGAPVDWDKNEAHCSGLPIRDVITPSGPFMISAWEPTPEELKALQAGASVNLWIGGISHPVVAISVGEIHE